LRYTSGAGLKLGTYQGGREVEREEGRKGEREGGREGRHVPRRVEIRLA